MKFYVFHSAYDGSLVYLLADQILGFYTLRVKKTKGVEIALKTGSYVFVSETCEEISDILK